MAVVVLNPGAPKAPVPRGPPILGWLFPNKDACPAPRAMETRGKNKCHRGSFDYCARSVTQRYNTFGSFIMTNHFKKRANVVNADFILGTGLGTRGKKNHRSLH